MKLKYKSYDFISLIGLVISSVGIYQNTDDKWLLAGWATALLLWFGHIIDSILSYNIHLKRESNIVKLENEKDELKDTIKKLEAELIIQRRHVENQQFIINHHMSNNTYSRSTQAIPKVNTAETQTGEQHETY